MPPERVRSVKLLAVIDTPSAQIHVSASVKLSRLELEDPLRRGADSHLMLLASLSTLIRPLRVHDDGTGRRSALWGELERGLSELQGAICALDLVD